MSNWDQETARLLELARKAHEPTNVDRARVHRLLEARQLADPTLFASAAGSSAISVAGVPLLKVVSMVCLGGALGAAVDFAVLAPAKRAPAGAASTQQSAPHLAPAARSKGEGQPLAVPADDGAGELSQPSRAAGVAERNATRTVAAPSGGTKVGMPPQSLLLELEGLRRAEQLLHRGDASAAIGALERLEQAVPAGSLREERDATRTLALCRLGRDPARAFISFAERYPTSVHLDNIRSLCLPSKASSRFALETEPASSSH